MTTLDSPVAQRLAAVEELAGVRAELAAVRARKARVLARRWRGDAVSWVREKIAVRDGWDGVWSKQKEILDAVQRGRSGDKRYRRTAVKSCHGVGKSYVAAMVAAWWLDVHPPGEAYVVTTAPTYAQVRAILWRYIRQLHKKGQLAGRVNQTEWHIDGEMVAFGRKPSDHDEAAFQGIHAPYVLVILDEAGGVPQNLWVAGDALTTNDGCVMLAIGNPDNPATYFKEVCDPLSDVGKLWHHIRISAFDSPNLTGEPVPDRVRKTLVSRGWIEEKLEEWGPDSPIYVSKVLGDFPSQNPMAVVRLSDVMDCRVRTYGLTRTPEELKPVALGVDVGGGGDLTVIRERRGQVAGREWTSNSDRPEELAPLVIEAIHASSATSVVVDSIGIGWGLIGELRNAKLAGVDIHAFNAAEKATDAARFANRRAELWWDVGRKLSADQAWDLGARDGDRMMGALLVDDRTIAELVEPRYSHDAAGRIKIESKDEIRARNGGRSPDHADALLMAFWTPAPGSDLGGWLSKYSKAAQRTAG